MVIDFSKLNQKEQPVLVLRNIDGTAIQTLGFAFNISGELCYNEMSSISFDVPKFANGIMTPHYDDIVGTRIIDMVGWGQFILVDPSVKKDGIKEIKSCKAYSLEYELTYKKMTLEENVYNFWNPVAREGTVIGIALSYLPSWSVGEIDPTLIGKYRNFSDSNVNIYNFLKSKVQQTFGCIIDFDTYNRKINAHAVSTIIDTKPIYISTENLAKEISVSEDTENIFTVLDVYGAETVNIRPVNPTGTNKIYNLDYYIKQGHLSDDMASKWAQWKTAFETVQEEYFSIAISRMLKTSQIVVESEALRQMQETDLLVLKNERSVYIEAIASLSDKTSNTYKELQDGLTNVNSRIAEKENEITSQQVLLASLEDEKKQLTEQMVGINESVSFDAFFNEDELIVLNRYFKEEAIEESSFVLSPVKTYTEEGVSSVLAEENFSIAGSKINMTTAVEDKQIFTITGGSITSGKVTANIIRASIEKSTDGKFVLAGYLSAGNVEGNAFESGCISICGECGDIAHDLVQDDTTSWIYDEGTSLSFSTISGRFFFTKNTSEYEEFSVAWDLFEYGNDCLRKLAWPSYSFKISSANFLSLDKFRYFAKQMALGRKVYIELADENVLQPILTKVSIEFEDPTSLNLEFGDTYSASDSSFNLVDLLDKSISMGKTLDTSRFSYNSFIDSGASTSVKEFIDGALDVSKNAILSGSDMAIEWDSSGFYLRKWNSDKSGYEPQQIAMLNNSIVFTNDNWATAEMAIGRFEDDNAGTVWGVVAPSIVGTLLAGENLVIESVKANSDGSETTLFKVDGNGALLHNARFDIVNDTNHIVLDPELGFAIGTYPVITQDNNGIDIWNETMTKFWVDTIGNVHLKGTLEGADGHFSGLVSGGSKDSYVAMNGNTIGDYSEYAFWAGNEDPALAEFWVKKDGTMSATNGIFKGIVQATDFLREKPDGTLVSMLDEESRFKSEHISLYGIDVFDRYNNLTFSIDDSGNVTINGDVNMGKDAVISWSQISDGDDVLDDAVGGVEDLVAALANGEYRGGTFIKNNCIYSPHIMGSDISLLGGYFKVQNNTGTTTYGSLGYGTGLSSVYDPSTGSSIYQVTEGVVLSAGGNTNLDSDDYYVIATNAGVRMQAKTSKTFVTDNLSVMEAGGNQIFVGPAGAYIKVDGITSKINSSSSAVFFYIEGDISDSSSSSSQYYYFHTSSDTSNPNTRVTRNQYLGYMKSGCQMYIDLSDVPLNGVSGSLYMPALITIDAGKFIGTTPLLTEVMLVTAEFDPKTDL